MNYKFLMIYMLIFLISCQSDRPIDTNDKLNLQETKMAFNKELWNVMEGKDYPYRVNMIDAILYTDTIRNMTRSEILETLGEPSYYRDNENYLYYRIIDKGVGLVTTYTKTIVIKMKEDSSVDWIKLHE